VVAGYDRGPGSLPSQAAGYGQAVENILESVNLFTGYLLRRSPPEDEEPLAEEPLLRLLDEPLEDLARGAGEDLLDDGALLTEGLGSLRLRLGELELALGRGEGEELLTSRERLGAG